MTLAAPPAVVLSAEEDDVVGCQANATLEREPHAVIPIVPSETEALIGERLEPAERVVGGSVIDHDQFVGRSLKTESACSGRNRRPL